MKSSLVRSIGLCLALAVAMVPAYSAGGISALVTSTTTNTHVIGTQQAENGYVIVDLDQPVTATSNDGCTTTTVVAMSIPALENQVLAMSMMAQATGKSVSGWISGCTTVWGLSVPDLMNFTVNQ